jgi:outer membrane protein OmpA-like peptidoglycan-associated protein
MRMSPLLLIALLSSHSNAQTTPGALLSADELVKQLAPPDPAVTAGRTRSLRNLKPAERSVDMSINFDFNSAKILPDSLPALEQLCIAMKAIQLAHTPFMVEGHTDAQGSASYNFDLSARRAQSVVIYLRANGIDAARLESVGKGFTELLNETDPFAPENRRVRIKALP